MSRITLFLFISLVAVLGMGQWIGLRLPSGRISFQAALVQDRGPLPPGALETSRRALIETVDRLVSRERYFHSIQGRYTSELARLNFAVPSGVQSTYDLYVEEATRERLIVRAVSRDESHSADLFSINQNFQVSANFPLPLPRAEYLREFALNHLRALDGTPDHRWIREAGVYSGYFKYEARGQGRNRGVFAVGIKAPVTGMQLEVGLNAPSLTGQVEEEFGWNAGQMGAISMATAREITSGRAPSSKKLEIEQIR